MKEFLLFAEAVILCGKEHPLGISLCLPSSGPKVFVRMQSNQWETPPNHKIQHNYSSVWTMLANYSDYFLICNFLIPEAATWKWNAVWCIEGYCPFDFSHSDHLILPCTRNFLGLFTYIRCSFPYSTQQLVFFNTKLLNSVLYTVIVEFSQSHLSGPYAKYQNALPTCSI